MSASGVRFLFVGKHHDEFRVVQQLLSGTAFAQAQFEHVDNLPEAQPLLLSDAYDAVLLDYFWPASCARDLLKTVQSHAINPPPILVFTESMNRSVDDQAVAEGAADYVILNQASPQGLERSLRYAMARKAGERHLAQLAHFDALTQIPNRLLFRDRLDHVLKLAQRNHKKFSLMFIDLNGFKAVNDNFGHDVGDEIIRICAKRLVSCLRKSDSVARLGGDEFTLLLPETDNHQDVAKLAEKVIAAVREPASINGYEVVVGCSVGIATYPDAGDDADTLMRNADLAMYRAKQQGANQICFFNDSLNQALTRQLRLESDLRVALKQQQFTLRYAPRVALASKTLVGFEAQLYWDKPGEGLVPACDFMHTAAEIGIIHAIGYWLLRRVCEDLPALKAAYGAAASVALECSLKLFKHEDLVAEVSQLFETYGVGPGEIEFQLSESVMSEHIDQVSLTMRPLAFFGIDFALCDFGSGNTSFMNLVRLPIAIVKVDGRIFAELNRSFHEKRLIEAMVRFIHTLGKRVLIDQVDTPQQTLWLESIGCDLIQGEALAGAATLETLLDPATRARLRTLGEARARLPQHAN